MTKLSVTAAMIGFTAVAAVGGACWLGQRQWRLNHELLEFITANRQSDALAVLDAGADPNTGWHDSGRPTWWRAAIERWLHLSHGPEFTGPSALALAVKNNEPDVACAM